MFSFAIVTFSPSSPAISSSAGAIIRHGPHHSAQKSTRTGPSEPRTSEAKLWSVTVFVVMAGVSPGRQQKLTSIWGLLATPSRRDFDEPWTGSVQQGRPDLPSREDHPQGLDIGHHLRAMAAGDVRIAGRHPACLEVDHRDTAFLDEESVDGTCDHASVGKRCCERRLAQRTGAE